MPRAIVTRISSLLVLALAVVLLAGCSKGEPSGTYQAKAPAGEQGTMTLIFEAGHKVKFVLESPMGKYEVPCDYKMEGDKVVISPPAGSPMSDVLTLTPKGNGYEATDSGQTVVFEKM